MDFEALLERVKGAPLFESAALVANEADSDQVKQVQAQSLYRQLSRWVKSGRIIQIRRGLYALAPPYRKTIPSEFLVANMLHQPSYVSLESALAWYHMIPEVVFVTTSVTTGRPGFFNTPLGRYGYRHIKATFYYGYNYVATLPDQWAFVATPEKALLDLLYFSKEADNLGFLRELRLQNLNQLDFTALYSTAQSSGVDRLQRAVDGIQKLRKDGEISEWNSANEVEFWPTLPQDKH